MSAQQDTWMQKYWRPAIAAAYIAIILFDFIIAPIFWSLLQAKALGEVAMQWAPLTLSSGGIFHATVGTILGISAFTRGKEKIERLRVGSNTDYDTQGDTDDGQRNKYN